MKTSDFDYILPKELIAQEPMRPRDHSRLMKIDRKNGDIQHYRFFEIESFLEDGDLLVVNNSKVFRARLETSDGREIFLLRPDGNHWLALARPGKTFQPGDTLSLKEGTGTVIEKEKDGTIRVDFDMPPNQVIDLANRIGEIPIPPYVKDVPSDERDYQTTYAKETGSVAAPTAGFHFTPELIDHLKAKGVRFAEVTLHVGLGTFRPMKTESLDEHVMHEEWIHVPEDTQRAIQETKKRGGRVIAVGTTTVRALESKTCDGLTNLFITPGFEFGVIDGLITNFHLPKSTLLVLVSSFAGTELIKAAYREAIENKYRFYSFGDAMLIV